MSPPLPNSNETETPTPSCTIHTSPLFTIRKISFLLFPEQTTTTVNQGLIGAALRLAGLGPKVPVGAQHSRHLQELGDTGHLLSWTMQLSKIPGVLYVPRLPMWSLEMEKQP